MSRLRTHVLIGRIIVACATIAALTVATGAGSASAAESAWLDSSFGTGGVASITPPQFSPTMAPIGATFSDGVRLTDGGTILVGVTRPPDTATCPQSLIARFGPDGSLDTTFNGTGYRTLGGVCPFGAGPRYSGLTAVAVQSTGKIIIGGAGSFVSTGFGVARLNADGSDDPTFTRITLTRNFILSNSPSCSRASQVLDLAVDSSDDVVVAGSNPVQVTPLVLCSSNAPASRDVPVVRRVGPDGDGSVALPSVTFAPSAGRAARAVVLSDGTPVVSVGSSLVWYSGSPVTVPQQSTALAADSAGGLLVLDDAGLTVRRYVDAAPDPAFAAGAGAATLPAPARTLAAGPSGRILATSVDTLVALTAEGVPDLSFGVGGSVEHGLSIPNAFSLTTLDGAGRPALAMASSGFDAAVFGRFAADGSRDVTFDQDGVQATALRLGDVNTTQTRVLAAAAGDGSLYLVRGGAASQGLYRATAAGSTDAAFGSVTAPPGRTFDAPAVDAIGRVLMPARDGAGTVLLRYLPSGGIDPSFGSAGASLLDEETLASAPVVDATGRIYLTVTRIGAPPGVVRLTPDGSIDTTFGVGGRAHLDVIPLSLAPLPSGGVVVGGSDSSGAAAVRLDDAGAAMPFARRGLIDAAWSLHVDPLGRIVAVLGGSSTFSAALAERLLADGTPDPTFGVGGTVALPPGVSGGGSGDMDASGRVLVGVVSPTGLASVLRLDDHGIADVSFGNAGLISRVAADPSTTFLKVLDDGRVVVKATAFEFARFVATPTTDDVAPSISVTTPAAGGRYGTGDGRVADYSCQDGGSGVASCTGSLPAGAALPHTPGPASMTVIATDAGGTTSTRTVDYRMVLGFTGIQVTPGASLDFGLADADQPMSFRLDGITQGGSLTALVDGLSSTPPGRQLVGQQLETGGIAGGASTPMTLEIRVDRPTLGLLGLNSTSAVVFRDGAAIAGCTAPTGATPDPCIESRSESATQASFVVRTSTLGTWTIGKSSDSTPPSASISSPVNGATFALGQTQAAAYACADDVALAATGGCVGPVAAGAPIDVSAPGSHTFTVVATDAAGLTSTATATYVVTSTIASGLGLTGSITSNPGGYPVSIVDAPAPDGVTVMVGGTGPDKVTLSVCGGFTVNISAGSTVTLTCGSVIAAVSAGSVEVVTPDGSASMAIGAGGRGELAANGTVISTGSTPIIRAKGFYAPVDMGGVWNSMKGGSTVPIKFELFSGATELTNPAVVSTTAVAVACGGGTDDAVEQLDTSGLTGLRYDTGSGQFQLNWKSPKSAGACYRVSIAWAGATLTGLFKLK